MVLMRRAWCMPRSGWRLRKESKIGGQMTCQGDHAKSINWIKEGLLVRGLEAVMMPSMSMSIHTDLKYV